jgi:hypothetical protein
MAQESFASFKELLLKKNFEDSEDTREVRYDILTNIFRYIQPNIIKSNIIHFEEKEHKALLGIQQHEGFKSENDGLSNGEYEAIVRDATKNIKDSSKLKLIDLLEKEVKESLKEKKKIDKISRNLKSNNPEEEKADLEDRIKDLHRDIIDIEMNLMSMENHGQEQTERFKKTLNARDKRKIIVGKLEKQLQKISKISKDKKD